MNFKKRSRYLPALVLLFLAFASCDDDFNTIGGELVGGQIVELPVYEAGVAAYNKNLTAVQTNNLPSHLLGVYQEPVYGQQIANVLTQISLSANNPSFGNEPRLDSVVLTLPYYSTRLEPDAEGNAVYRLDSIYGDDPFKLSISRSNYFLNDFDPDANFENRQRYYSNQGPLFESNLVGDPIYVNESFKPSPNQVVYLEKNQTGEIDTARVSPRLRINLPVSFFQENLLNKEGSNELFNNNNFRNFIRGLYFNAEPINGNGSMLLLNFNDAAAGILLYYTNTAAEGGAETQNTFKITFGPNTVNTFSQELPTAIKTEIEESNELPGAENIYLRGGEGTMAVVELFENDAEINELRAKNWIINEANLTFFVNQDLVEGGKAEPSRIYLYNLETNQMLFDYNFDPTINSENPNLAVSTHLPQLRRDDNGNGIFYKIRITEHVRRVLQELETNAKLGLVVTQNIQAVNPVAVKPPVDGISRIPSGTVITPKGTVLHGNLSSDTAKRLKFNIYYTETSN